MSVPEIPEENEGRRGYSEREVVLTLALLELKAGLLSILSDQVPSLTGVESEQPPSVYNQVVELYKRGLSRVIDFCEERLGSQMRMYEKRLADQKRMYEERLENQRGIYKKILADQEEQEQQRVDRLMDSFSRQIGKVHHNVSRREDDFSGGGRGSSSLLRGDPKPAGLELDRGQFPSGAHWRHR